MTDFDTNRKVAFVVLSCDSYSDLWQPYAELFHRFWPDCPYDKFFASNHITPDVEGFAPILIGEDISWSHGLNVVLSQLEKKYSYVFITLDDIILTKKVDTLTVCNTIKSFVDLKGNYLRMYFRIRPPMSNLNSYLGPIANDIPYRQTTVFTVWRIDTLKSILKDDESAWEFEKIGVKRGFHYDGFYCSNKSLFTSVNLIVKRKMVKSEYNKIKEMLPDVKFDRPFLSAKELYVDNCLKVLLLRLFIRFFPAKYQKCIYFKWNK